MLGHFFVFLALAYRFGHASFLPGVKINGEINNVDCKLIGVTTTELQIISVKVCKHFVCVFTKMLLTRQVLALQFALG